MGIIQSAGAALLIGLAGTLAVPVAPVQSQALTPTCTKTGTARAEVLTGTAGPDIICGLGGADTLKGVGGNDILVGGPGNDTLHGGDGADRLEGGDDNDKLTGGVGADVMSGGLGSDLVRYDDRYEPVVISVGRGADDGGQNERDDVGADVERVYGGSAYDKIVTYGTAPVQFLGKGGNDELVGGPGADKLQGDAGNDFLVGAGGVDNYNCGAGVDYYQQDGSDITRFGCEKVAPNRAPTPGTDYLQTDEDTPVQVEVSTLLANDADPDNDALTFVGLTTGSSFARGTAVLNGTTITFTPTADYDGGAGNGSFAYTISDGKASVTGHVAVVIKAVNDAPVAVDDQATVKQDASVTISIADLLANDRDVDSVKQVASVQDALNGTVQLTPTSNQSGQAVVFTPTAGYCGPAGFDYTLSDGSLTDVGHVSVTVTCTPPPPPPPHIVPGRDFLSATEDTQFSVDLSDLLANDVDVDGHPLTITDVQSGMYGEVWLEGGRVMWQPEQDYCGDEAWFGYRVSDGTRAAIGVVHMNVDCVNDPPWTWLQIDVTEVDTPLVLDADDIDYYDIDSPFSSLSVVRVQNPTNGTVSLSNGVITFTPASGFCGDAGFDYVVSDGDLEATEHFYVFVDGPPGC